MRDTFHSDWFVARVGQGRVNLAQQATGRPRFAPVGPPPPAVPPPPLSDPASVTRLAGPERISTAVAVSQDHWDQGQARSAVVARADIAADALAATPLAMTGPLLLSSASELSDVTADELTRAVQQGGVVYLAGGEAALSSHLQEEIADLGFTPTRLAGLTRYATAVHIAEEVDDNPQKIYLADGTGFAEALVAGAAAARQVGAVVLLTAGDQISAETRAVLRDHPNAEVIAVGTAATATGAADRAVVGVDVYDTARLLASELPAGDTAALASGEQFPDGLAGGAHAAVRGLPLLLTRRDNLPDPTAAFLRDAGVDRLVVYGGHAAVSTEVTNEALPE